MIFLHGARERQCLTDEWYGVFVRQLMQGHDSLD